jgi:hypothetical protein
MTAVVVIALIVAGALCFSVWRLAKAGGGVKVGFVVDVRWGGRK